MTDPYATVLADLEAKRGQIDAAIAAIHALSPSRRVEAVAVKHPTVARPKIAKAGRACKKCGGSGHNKRTCPGPDTGKVIGLHRRCGECSQRTPAKGSCNHCGAKESAA